MHSHRRHSCNFPGPTCSVKGLIESKKAGLKPFSTYFLTCINVTLINNCSRNIIINIIMKAIVDLRSTPSLPTLKFEESKISFSWLKCSS